MFVAGKIAKSMGNLAVETTSVAQCMRLYRALGDQIGVWVQFRGRRLRLVQLEEMGHEEGAWDAPGASQEVGNLQYLGDCKKIALCLKVQYVLLQYLSTYSLLLTVPFPRDIPFQYLIVCTPSKVL